MKPYYSERGITIYHGDARAILPLVSADVLVTDPPYGVDFEGKATKHTTKKSGGYIGVDDPDIGPAVVREALGLVKRAAVFPGNRALMRYPEPQDIGCVYCPSGAGIGPWGFICFHPVLFYGKRPTNLLRPTSIQSFATADDVEHPCPKPTRWMTWVIGMVCLPGETVLDPFMGSGTTLRAAKDSGLKAIGIEIEERYCEVAVKRLAQETIWRDIWGERDLA